MSFKLVSDADLKTYMDISETTWDTMLGDISEQVAQEFEGFLHRKLENTGSDVVEYRSPTGTESIVWVSRYPIVSITTIHEDLQRSYSSDSVVDSSDYFSHDDEGLIELESRCWYGGNRVVKITYKGGYTKTSEVLVGLPDAITLAAKMQIAHNFNRRQSPGASTVNFGGGGSQSYTELGMLQTVKDKLQPYQRRRT